MVYFMLHPTHPLSTITTIRTMAVKHVDSHDGCDVARVSAAVFMSYLPLTQCYTIQEL